jgi:TonB-linked SusC/RagA family outer membrane protein
MGFFGRLNYDYKNKYLLEINARYDGTSRFRSGNRWTMSPSAALAWNIAREDFMSPYEHIISMLKLRVSYGVLSNQNTTNYYPTYSNMNLSTANSGWIFGGVQSNTAYPNNTLENPYLSWETVKTTNFGLDFGFLSNRLTGTVEIFRRDNENMLGPAPTRPAVIGALVPRENNTSLKDQGFEVSLGWQDRLKSGLSYSFRFNLQDSKTVITEYPNPTGALPDANNSTYNKGHQTFEIWGYQTIGIAKTQEEMNAHLATLPNGGQNAIYSGAWRAGDIMYKDVNGDGKIDRGSQTLDDHGDYTVIGNSTPRYRVGLDMNATWKGFDFRLFFQGTLKRDYWINSYYFWGADSGGQWWSTGLKPHLDYFRDDPESALGLNTDSYYPRPYFSGTRNKQVQTGYLQDASYIRLKNLQLGYTLPSSLTNKITANRIRIYFSGDNLTTFTNLTKLFDPEGITASRGASYPLSRVFSFGVNVNF